jgi:hypothetical protein
MDEPRVFGVESLRIHEDKYEVLHIIFISETSIIQPKPMSLH